MTEQEEKFAFALAALMGLVARGASPTEARDMMWTYAKYALEGKHNEEFQPQ